MATATRALFMLFGATGDLAKRKLYPSIFNLYKKGYIDQEHFALIGTGRREWSDDKFHEVIVESVKDNAESEDEAKGFASHFYYMSHDVTNPEHYDALSEYANKLDDKYDIQGNRIFYISMAPNFFGTVAKNLKAHNCLSDNGGFNRLIIEKPFGRDYESAEELNNALGKSFNENQVYRIDHYLGKEMVQNILALRFGNPLIEGIWNNKYIKNVQVTLAEKLGVEERAGYYDGAGALRDMIQNHTMQMLSILTMEDPVSFKDVDVRSEKIRALRSMRIYSPDGVRENFVRGQYGKNGDQADYRHEDNVPENSNTETYVAGKVMFDNQRWANVPFYIRTGKMLADKFTRIDIVFKKPLIDIFAASGKQEGDLQNNVLTLFVDPVNKVILHLNGKKAGQGMEMQPLDLTHVQSDAEKAATPEPYERLIHDAILGDATNFASWDEVGRAWKFADVIRNVWDHDQPDFPNYTPGSMGPKAADELLARDGNEWIKK
ncbi:glucose-6-phosphate dehydrogenase [Apilactobacillus timberlakei]|uniref:glucose-6-phosphate dehydrogenase n=1 Tax=Apilactobacillus timberlakei TaxID=2008380 RepID=UPI00112A1C9B|nr:glucose-6-phosphate dehydrogenase [Apilactobacillus timberlakei]TPR18080.1 glucose-6-phosphate dehydrogenase [Apilactobacillus timberlakei]